MLEISDVFPHPTFPQTPSNLPFKKITEKEGLIKPTNQPISQLNFYTSVVNLTFGSVKEMFLSVGKVSAASV